MRFVLILIDGVGDTGSATPLQQAHIPTINHLAECGVTGLMDPVEPSLACGSDTAHLSLFGYDPRKWYRGRGSFESMGCGLSMAPGDIAFKSNFACVAADNLVIKRRASRQFEHIGPELCHYLTMGLQGRFDPFQVEFQYATEHRCGVRVRGPGLSDAITGTDPLKDNLPLLQCRAIDPSDSAAVQTACLVNYVSDAVRELLALHSYNNERRKLSQPDVNCVLFRGCGMRIDCPPFQQLYPKLWPAFGIAPTCIISGLLQTIQIPVLDRSELPGCSGSIDSDFMQKGRACVKHMNLHPDIKFCFLHIKGVDDAGHDFRADLKTSLLERIDGMVKFIVDELKHDPLAMCITADHSTPASEGDHSHEPVPVLLWRSDGRYRDQVTKFNEIDCARGVLERFRGQDLMRLVESFVD